MYLSILRWPSSGRSPASSARSRWASASSTVACRPTLASTSRLALPRMRHPRSTGWFRQPCPLRHGHSSTIALAADRLMKSSRIPRGAAALGGISIGSPTGMKEPLKALSEATRPAICRKGVTRPSLFARRVSGQSLSAKSIWYFFLPMTVDRTSSLCRIRARIIGVIVAVCPRRGQVLPGTGRLHSPGASSSA